MGLKKMNNKEVRLIVSDIQDMMETIADKLEHLYENHIDVEEFKKEEGVRYKRTTFKSSVLETLKEQVQPYLDRARGDVTHDAYSADMLAEYTQTIYELLSEACENVRAVIARIEEEKEKYWDK